MKTYKFKVSRVENIDLARMAKECEGVAFVIETSKGSVIFVRQGFLNKFRSEDGMKIGPYELMRVWGDYSIKAKYPIDKIVSIDGWKVLGNFGCEALSIEFLATQIEAAKKFRRSVEVTVHTF